MVDLHKLGIVRRPVHSRKMEYKITVLAIVFPCFGRSIRTYTDYICDVKSGPGLILAVPYLSQIPHDIPAQKAVTTRYKYFHIFTLETVIRFSLKGIFNIIGGHYLFHCAVNIKKFGIM